MIRFVVTLQLMWLQKLCLDVEVPQLSSELDAIEILSAQLVVQFSIVI